ncbi:hypothetical protein [Arthrobacter sp. ERGS1:01]|uniref:hypothetical protein n=1 Tax=Arthrobacter sp. ERGS1:01 TaxID=1704044 RepID=UPI000A6F5FAA|nr:hypothetical protein [Arthrobacter sp. ERGS1:01]
MEATKTMNGPTPEDDDLGQASVRELIVKLALTEDELRNPANPARIAFLVLREQEIVAALHRNGLALNSPPRAKLPEPSISPCPVEGRVAK